MPDHAVLDPRTTDVRDALSACAPDGALVVVLSSRPLTESFCEPSAWIHGGSLDNMCQRFKRYRKTYPSNQTWVVVVDVGDAAPVSKAYNQLFKNGRITVVTVSSAKATLKDYRFTTRFDADYAVVESAPTKPPPPSSWWPF